MTIQYSDTLLDAIKKYEAIERDHARAIGELCMSWAAMDNTIDDLLEPLLNCDRGVSASIATSIDRLEPRLAIVKRLLIHQNTARPWREWLESVLNRVTNEFAPLRNRYVHDRWQMRKGEMQRVEKRAITAKPQSRQPDKLLFDCEHVTPIGELERLRANIDTVTYAIQIAAYDLRNWRTTGRLRPLRKQLIPASRPRTRMDRFPMTLVWNGERLPPYSYATDP